MTAIAHRYGQTLARATRGHLLVSSLLLFFALSLLSGAAFGHAVAEGDKGYIQETVSYTHLTLPTIYSV